MQIARIDLSVEHTILIGIGLWSWFKFIQLNYWKLLSQNKNFVIFCFLSLHWRKCRIPQIKILSKYWIIAYLMQDINDSIEITYLLLDPFNLTCNDYYDHCLWINGRWRHKLLHFYPRAKYLLTLRFTWRMIIMCTLQSMFYLLVKTCKLCKCYCSIKLLIYRYRLRNDLQPSSLVFCLFSFIEANKKTIKLKHEFITLSLLCYLFHHHLSHMSLMIEKLYLVLHLWLFVRVCVCMFQRLDFEITSLPRLLFLQSSNPKNRSGTTTTKKSEHSCRWSEQRKY